MHCSYVHVDDDIYAVWRRRMSNIWHFHALFSLSRRSILFSPIINHHRHRRHHYLQQHATHRAGGFRRGKMLA